MGGLLKNKREVKAMSKQSAYKATSVNWGKSQSDIGKLLDKQGIQDVRFTFLSSRNELICEFNYPAVIENEEKPVGVRITLPIPQGKNIEQSKNQIHRALFYYLKSKFESMNFGLVEFMDEFMAHLVIYDKKGQSKTLSQHIMPQFRQGLVSGEQGDIKMLPTGDTK